MSTLIGQHAASDLVAFDDPRTASDLYRDVSVVAAVLPASSAPQRVLLVFEKDRYAFTVSLLATWARGHVAVLPPDNRRSTLSRLNATCDAVLHDTYFGLKHQVQALLSEPDRDQGDDRGAIEAVNAAWSGGQAMLEVYGATARGSGQAWHLTSSMLHEELARLDVAVPWPHGVRVASTIPIGSRYGLVWTVLRPLATGGAVQHAMRSPPIRWARRPADTGVGSKTDTLITVPHDLRVAIEQPPEAKIPRWSRIVSSVTPLDADVASEAIGRFGANEFALLEVFSTTGHGSIGVRSVRSASGGPDKPAAEAWTLLKGVQADADADGHLVLDARRTANRVRFDDVAGEFVFRGRDDQQCGSGEDIVTTNSLARTVRRYPGVDDAAVVLHQVEGQPTFLVSVVGGSGVRDTVRTEVQSSLVGTGARAVVAAVSSLPRDSLGRLPLSQALLLFGYGADGTPRARELIEGPARIEEDAAAFELTVPRNYRWFDGHFEDYPVLPAAIQLHELVLPCVEKTTWRREAQFRGAVRLKFTGRIEPGAQLVVKLQSAADGAVTFEIETGGRPASSGRLQYARATVSSA